MMKNLFFLGTSTFIIPFVSSLAVTLNLTASALLGGIIAATVTITIVWFLSQKYQRAFKKLDRYAESFKNIESQISSLKKQNRKLLKEIEILKEEEESLKTQLEELQNYVKKIESKVVIERQNKPQLPATEKPKVRVPDTRKIAGETNTLYAQKLTSVPKDFWSIYEYNVESFRSQVPRNDRGLYCKKLKRGLEILSEEKTLLAYVAIYAASHYYKLSYLLEELFRSLTKLKINENIEIIDYGCGQALATTCFIDYLKQNGLSNKTIAGVTLIEPSQIALSRGILHINHLGLDSKTTELKPINKNLEDLNQKDLSTSINNLKIHLFSNILDVPGFEINNLANTIKESQSGSNYFLCVSPTDSNNRIEEFFNFWNQNGFHTEEIPLSSEDLYQETWNLKLDKFSRRKIHRVQKLFHVNLDNLIPF